MRLPTTNARSSVQFVGTTTMLSVIPEQLVWFLSPSLTSHSSSASAAIPKGETGMACALKARARSIYRWIIPKICAGESTKTRQRGVIAGWASAHRLEGACDWSNTAVRTIDPKYATCGDPQGIRDRRGRL
jgi:hypothetical protein